MKARYQNDPRERRLVLSLKEERLRQGLSITKLAAKIKTSRSGVGHIEGDRSRPTLAMLLKIADGLGVRLSEYMKAAEES